MSGPAGQGTDDWWKRRPRVRRFGAVASTFFTTGVPALFALLVTGVVVGSVGIPGDANLLRSMRDLGAVVAQDALSFDAIVIGVLASLLIAQVLTRRPRLDTRRRIGRFLSVTMFAHVLAGFALAALCLAVIGAIDNAGRARHLWVLVAATVVAVAVAQWIERHWLRNRRLARNRTHTEITTNAAAIHRYAAVLYERPDARRWPWLKLLLHVLLLLVSATAAGVGVAALVGWAMAGRMASWPALMRFGSADASAALVAVMTAAVCVLAQVHQATSTGRIARSGIAVWVTAAGVLLAPVALTVFVISLQELRYVVWGAGTSTTLLLPAAALLLPVRSFGSFAGRVIAVQLSTSRRYRYALLRDVYVVEKPRSTRKRKKRLFKTIALQRLRPDDGPGSATWCAANGRSARMYPPARRSRFSWWRHRG